MKLNGLFPRKILLLVIDNYKNLCNLCNPYYEVNTLFSIYIKYKINLCRYLLGENKNKTN